MSDFSPKRFLLTISLLCAATAAFASSPSARYETRMAYDASTHRAILFGGLTATDTGTKQPYYLSDTWQWNGIRWVQLFPAHSPSGRAGEMMVYDSIRDHIVIFGGRSSTADLADTWYFNGIDWVELTTPNTPPARFLAGGAYDSARDRIVMFGGMQSTTTTIGTSTTTTTAPVYDTWEFDGTTWKKIGGEGPHVGKPMLVYDEARNQVLLVGIDDKGATLMYAYDASAAVWNQLKPTTLPACVNEGVLVYDAANAQPLFTSGVCSTTAVDTETMEWDGTNWKKIDVKSNAVRLFGAAAAYDVQRNDVVMFGGTPPGATPTNLTYIYTTDAGWNAVSDTTVPGPRSLFTMTTDPVHNTIWFFGGIRDGDIMSDLWQFKNGQWEEIKVTDNAPSTCGSPNAAFDTDRQKLVVVCSSSETFEWDGTAWKKFDGLKTAPTGRSFSSMVYDQTLKKTVLFGGFDGANYRDETWTWDGTQWSRVKSNPAPSRELASMWWDPILKKTVIYGGLGRLTSQDRITRYDDMWTFDGNGWTQLKPASGTPGMRYGALVGVDPRTNHTILFGGLRVDTVPPVPPSTVPGQVQVYASETWEWDGTAWTKRTTDGNPPARENGGLTFDPTLNVMVMYGGYAGTYLSDMWTLTGNMWRVRAESAGGRRRAVTGH